jgi:hypothetical protein
MLLFSMHVRFCTFIPFLVFLEHFISFLFSIPQIHSNGIVLTQSLYLLRRFDSCSKCMRICCNCNTGYRPLLLHTSTSTIPTARPQPFLISLCFYSVPPATRCSLWLYLDTGDATQRYHSKDDAQIRPVLSSLSSRLSSCVFNTFVLSLPNITHPNFRFGSRRHRRASRLSVLHPIFNAMHFPFCFFPHSATPFATHRNKKSNKWFCFFS